MVPLNVMIYLYVVVFMLGDYDLLFYFMSCSVYIITK
jgi:hypothetical protein